MPFVTNILGPGRPVVPKASPLVGGLKRRTSTIDTHPDDSGGSVVDLRARDAMAAGADRVEVLRQIRVSAYLAGNVIDTINATPQDNRLDALRGCRVGAGFRSKVA